MPDRKKFALILSPFSLLYRIIVTSRNLLFDWGFIKAEKFDIPVISVGNITVGGTGKTPHTEYLIQLLHKKFSLAVLSRGYKRKSKGFVLGSTGSTVRDIGDEPLQIKRKFPKITVAVDAKRINGIQTLLKNSEQDQKPIDAILLDDAYQHRYVIPGLSILLIDYNNPIDEDRMLPAGNLREPEKSKQRANIIIVTKCPENLKPIDLRILIKRFKTVAHQSLYFTTLKHNEPQSVFDHTRLFESINETSTALVVTGIAQPEIFKAHIDSIVKESELLQFPDHHQFTKKDFELIKKRYLQIGNKDKVIITTEKDAMRLFEVETLIPKEIKSFMYYIPVRVEFLYNGKKEFDKTIIDYVNQNKRNR
ncbi:tetraacyldisaccharide 4'-kinase [Saccharicrinis sp. FJH54]|uniref:tetraacyldisaccharide 4'-kinase n=1 Tax=Saccharicrinis sp. FJH54 TaxID=3344665 RepID=UPI0035D3F3DE